MPARQCTAARSATFGRLCQDRTCTRILRAKPRILNKGTYLPVISACAANRARSSRSNLRSAKPPRWRAPMATTNSTATRSQKRSATRRAVVSSPRTARWTVRSAVSRRWGCFRAGGKTRRFPHARIGPVAASIRSPRSATPRAPPAGARMSVTLAAALAIVRGWTRPLHRADGSRTTSTSAEGCYEVKDLPAGRFTIRVARSGYLQPSLRAAPPARTGDAAAAGRSRARRQRRFNRRVRGPRQQPRDDDCRADCRRQGRGDARGDRHRLRGPCVTGRR